MAGLARGRGRSAALVVAAGLLAAVWLAQPAQAAPAASTPTLARVVYLTTSQGCACTMKRVHSADAVLARVFTGPRARLVSQVDMATSKDASSYIQKYHVMVLPALLMLDGQGRLLWSAQGELSAPDITTHLSQFGG